MLKDGGRHYAGVDEALLKNIQAGKELARIVKTSFGPFGMNKLLVNHIGKHFVSSDSATILKELEVMHPAAKILVMAAEAQHQECGDGTTYTIMFAGELLEKAEKLLQQGIHSCDIIKGFEMASAAALNHLVKNVARIELQCETPELLLKKISFTCIIKQTLWVRRFCIRFSLISLLQGFIRC